MPGVAVAGTGGVTEQGGVVQVGAEPAAVLGDDLGGHGRGGHLRELGDAHDRDVEQGEQDTGRDVVQHRRLR